MLRNINKYKFFLLFTLPYTLYPIPYLHSQTKVTTIINASLLGGQYFLDDENASFEGNLNLFASPVIKFSDNVELVPLYTGYYNGTQDVQELAGGGVLTRERQNHAVSLKYVRSKDFNKFKPRISYSISYVKETEDEDWGDGLFDYNTMSAGIEAEQERPDAAFVESYDFYMIKYPNYSTLLSQSGTVIDTATYSELSVNAGTDVLDNANHKFAFKYTWFPEPLVLSGGYEFTYRTYGDQAVVAKPATGTPYFTSDKRKDLVNAVSFSAVRNIKPVYLRGVFRTTWLSSNQNSYDSSRTKYVDDNYSYLEFYLAPEMSMKLKNESLFSFSTGLKKLYYLGRLVQDASGNYSGSKIHQTSWLSTLSARYPLTNRFFARASYSYQISSSNMKYEAGYRYNYRASNYLLGIEWEF
ncbi:MAG: hypothetical protein HY746_03495 [Elusimicrobia bacterium]|nr:hypothetical protein [Elusimicrobiota bacterium]